eukprot:NODE_4002_length_616_cov_95.370370_g2879_i0.p1 GENE.NODE_4002_length_616_cov_95.370370_g2879_i0~~NODE_4002_length_616_cov_95.370370_g2879_i0.p1  ORF type:complete len:97 (+),score=2.89 NODE_4002_length_616_cov_95.370370_g2879_i0:252-542(+)
MQRLLIEIAGHDSFVMCPAFGAMGDEGYSSWFFNSPRLYPDGNIRSMTFDFVNAGGRKNYPRRQSGDLVEVRGPCWSKCAAPPRRIPGYLLVSCEP